MALIMSMVPFGVTRRDNGSYLRPDSIKGSGGECVANWSHWQDDSYSFTHPATWVKVSDSIVFMHNLDLAVDAERRVYELAQAGDLEISYGVEKTPNGTRAAVAMPSKRLQRQRQSTKARPVMAHDIGHLSYCRAGDAAFPQEAPKVIFR